MIPLRDDVPAGRRPVVTHTLVALCAVVFLLQLGDEGQSLVERYGCVPARLLGRADGQRVREVVDTVFGPLVRSRGLAPAAVPEWLTVLTCTFLHGGWLHFLGNMLFLWIFGDNVEDRLGRPGFLAFYLGCGAVASLAHLWSAPDSTLPTIGASGAIAGVMGAYLVLYPRARVQMLVIWGPFLDFVVLPAPFFLGYWFLLQFLQGSLQLGSRVATGGVAFWAHIGGFVAGVAVALLLRAVDRLRPAAPTIVLRRRSVGRPQWPF